MDIKVNDNVLHNIKDTCETEQRGSVRATGQLWPSRVYAQCGVLTEGNGAHVVKQYIPIFIRTILLADLVVPLLSLNSPVQKETSQSLHFKYLFPSHRSLVYGVFFSHVVFKLNID